MCYVHQGDLPLKIGWKFDNRLVTPGYSEIGIRTFHIGARSSLLMITSALPTHSGSYTCFAENRAARTEYSVTLDIHGILLKICKHCMVIVVHT